MVLSNLIEKLIVHLSKVVFFSSLAVLNTSSVSMAVLNTYFAFFLCFTLVVSVFGRGKTMYLNAELGCKVVNTRLGLISGVQLSTIWGGKPFCGYRGIRFGQAPVGDLRFKVRIFYLRHFLSDIFLDWNQFPIGKASTGMIDLQLIINLGSSGVRTMGRHTECCEL